MKKDANTLVIFDCDGVLVDSEPISFAVLREMLAEAGVDLNESWAYRNFLGKSMASITGLIAEEFSITLAEDSAAKMRTRLYDRLRTELQPVPGVRELLPDFAYMKCVASSSQPERIRLSLTKTGLIDFFDPDIFSATMVKNGKPAPDLFLHAAGKMGFAPENCVVVEDSPAGIRAAQSAGMQVFAFVGGGHAPASNLKELVEALKPTVIFDDMSQLSPLLAAAGH